MSETIEEIQKRREDRKAAIAEERLVQRAIDLAALDELEVTHGDGNVSAMALTGAGKGLPTFIVVKSPGGTSFYTRYKTMVRQAGKNYQAIGAAQEMLGESCIVYPPDGEKGSDARKFRDMVFAAYPGATISAGIHALKMAELEAEDTKKE